MMLRRRKSLRLGLALACWAMTHAAGAQTLPSGPRIKELAGPVWFGLRTDSRARSVDKTIFMRECNAGQFTHYPAWGGWPERGSYNLSTLGANNDYFRDAGMPSVMHMFVGPDQYLPTWLKDGTWDPETLDQLLKELIGDTIASAEGKDVSLWNVVNEAVDWGGAGWGGTKFLELGYEADASGLTGDDKIFDEVPIYIRKAFEYARQNSTAELELRDYDNDGLENQNNNSLVKTKGFYQLVRHLLALNTPVTAVGFQGHFNISNPITWNNLTDNVRRYRELGLKVYISEMDAQQNDNATTWDAAIAELQGEYYYNYVKAALAGGVSGIFVWGVRDNQDRGWRRGENAVLFDDAGDPKPAYYGVQRAFVEFVSGIGGAGGAPNSAHAGSGGIGGDTAAAGGVGGVGGAESPARSAYAGSTWASGKGGAGHTFERDAGQAGAGGAEVVGGSSGELEAIGGMESVSQPGDGFEANGGAGGTNGAEHTRSEPDSSNLSSEDANQLGGSGCACRAGTERNSPLSILLLALGVLGLRRRRPVRG